MDYEEMIEKVVKNVETWLEFSQSRENPCIKGACKSVSLIIKNYVEKTIKAESKIVIDGNNEMYEYQIESLKKEIEELKENGGKLKSQPTYEQVYPKGSKSVID